MLIEAYGAPGALALGDRLPLDFLVPLIEQTKQMRKSEDDLDEEIIAENQERFFEKNKHKSVQLPDGKKISIAQFTVNSDELLEGIK